MIPSDGTSSRKITSMVLLSYSAEYGSSAALRARLIATVRLLWCFAAVVMLAHARLGKAGMVLLHAHETHHAFDNAQVALELFDGLRLGLVLEQVIVALPLFADRIREVAHAPIPVLVDRAALARNDSLESSEELCSLLAEIGAKHDQCFVWTHSDSFLVRTFGFVRLGCCLFLLSVGCSACA